MEDEFTGKLPENTANSGCQNRKPGERGACLLMAGLSAQPSNQLPTRPRWTGEVGTSELSSSREGGFAGFARLRAPFMHGTGASEPNLEVATGCEYIGLAL
jgi:hypothetical protein